MRILWFALTLALMAVLAPAAQSQQDDIPLTYEAFSHLTAQQAARRLIGPSGELVTQMIIGRSALDAALLNAVRLYTKPKAAHAGLCERTEIDVLFERADPTEKQTASTLMKISGVGSGHEYYVVGDLAASFDEKTKTATDELCSAPIHPLDFFQAAYPYWAWEAAILFEAALRDIQMGGRQRFDSECTRPACSFSYDFVPKLTPQQIRSVEAGCGEPIGPIQTAPVCYTISLEGLQVYVEAVRDRTVPGGVSFRRATFRSIPVVRI